VDGDGNVVTSSLNVWIQSGSYILIAFSEILASITGLEYAFTKAPKNMKSLVMAVFLFTSAVASAIGEAFNGELCIYSTGPVFTQILALSTDPLLVWNYGTMAVLSGVGGLLFWLSYRGLDAEDAALDNIGESHYYVVES
jgi:POT family proton-dependent oligopeptide transporter